MHGLITKKTKYDPDNPTCRECLKLGKNTHIDCPDTTCVTVTRVLLKGNPK